MHAIAFSIAGLAPLLLKMNSLVFRGNQSLMKSPFWHVLTAMDAIRGPFDQNWKLFAAGVQAICHCVLTYIGMRCSPDARHACNQTSPEEDRWCGHT